MVTVINPTLSQTATLAAEGSYEKLLDTGWRYLALLNLDRTAEAYAEIMNRHEVTALKNANLPIWDGLPTETLLILAEGGIGDEIRWGCLYDQAIKQSKNVIITCDPRLQDIWKWKWPQAQVIPVTRFYNDLAKGRHATPQDLSWLLNDEAYSKTKEATAIVPAMCLQTFFKPDGLPYLSNGVEVVPNRIGFSEGSHVNSDTKIHHKLGWEFFRDKVTDDWVYLGLNNPPFRVKRPDPTQYANNIANALVMITTCEEIFTTPNFVLDFAGAVGVKTTALLKSRQHEWRFRKGHDYFYHRTASEWVK